MGKLRLSWVVLIAAAIAVTAVPALRALAATLPSTLARGLRAHVDTVRFVEQHKPDDPEMLAAAGLVALSVAATNRADVPEAERKQARKAGVDVLRRAAAGGSAAACAAYSGVLLSEAEYEPLGGSTCDLGDPQTIAEVEEKISTARSWVALDESAAEPIISALQGWQQADPDNGLPVALEAKVLYGLADDDEALGLWKRAASLPDVSDRWQERKQAISLLLRRMRFPELEAEAAAWDAMLPTDLHLCEELRTGAAIAYYEGHRARLEGDTREAVARWDASIQLGRRLQASADTERAFLHGLALEGQAASPVWVRRPDERTGVPGGPFEETRYWHGSQHDLYVEQMGEAAGAQLRDRLVAGRVRSQLLRDYLRRGSMDLLFDKIYATWYARELICLAGAVIILLAIYAMVSVRGRAAADGAISIGFGWKAGLTLLSPLVGFGMRTGWAYGRACLDQLRGMDPHPLCFAEYFWSSVVAIPAAAALLVLEPTLYRRRAGARLGAAWRGNVRAAFPVVAAFLALITVVMGILSAPQRSRVATHLKRPELARIAEAIGPEWNEPTIPPDAWRAESPPR